MDWTPEMIPVPVTDVDRARAFYAKQIGFAIDLDVKTAPGRRLVQLTPPGSGRSIHLGSGNADACPPPVRGLQLVVSDIEAARAHLTGSDVACSSVRNMTDGEWREGQGGRWNAFVLFDDPDGNGWVLQERPAE